MARPVKYGLDYFPLDTTIFNDIRIRRLKRNFGADSFLLYITLLCDIYSIGYYLEADDDYLLDLSERMQMRENKVLEMVLYCLDLGLFDKGLFNKSRVLSSKSIQRRFFEATRKRTNNQPIEYDLIGVSSSETPVFASESTQRKEKESKEKKRKDAQKSRIEEMMNIEQEANKIVMQMLANQ